MKHICAAILQKDTKYLICKRAPGGSCGNLWEFPGGKLEPGEAPEACAIRECREELQIDIELTQCLDTVYWRYPDGELCLTFFLGFIRCGEPQCLVHTQLAWVRPEQLARYEFCPADVAIVRRLIAQNCADTSTPCIP